MWSTPPRLASWSNTAAGQRIGEVGPLSPSVDLSVNFEEEGIMTMRQITVLVGAVCLLAGWMAGGSRQAVQAQETPGGQFARGVLGEGEWRMHSDPVTNMHRGTWLYNVKTGKVYRVLATCGADGKLGADGCLSPLPVLSSIEARIRDTGLGLLPKSR